MSIFIARHGQTDDNAAQILQRPESPLSEKGKDQAQRLGVRLERERIQQIICSDYVRTRQTTDCILQSINAPVRFSPLLRERNFGDLRGCHYSDLQEHPFSANLVPPNGESWSEFHLRVNQAWGLITDMRANTAGAVLVITHGLVCQSLFDHHLTGCANEEPNYGVLNTALTRVVSQAPWKIEFLNCTKHLDSPSRNASTAPA